MNHFKNIGYAILVSFLAALLTGCQSESPKYRDLPRDGTPIYYSVEPGVLIPAYEIEIGARIWDSVGVNFQLSPVYQPEFKIEHMEPIEGIVALTFLVQSYDEPSVLIQISMDGNWHAIAHELGHALGLGHVDHTGPGYVCNIMSSQLCDREGTLSDGDINEFERSGVLSEKR